MERTHKASLARFSTLKIGGEADQLCVPATADELLVLMDGLKGNSEPWHILGGGSNILISSKGVPGTVIRLTQLTEILHPEPEVVEAGTGARLPHVARYAASIGLSGLEFAVGIPGTVGGAVVMNAGAHGSAIADVLESVTLFDTTTWNTVTWSAADLGFAYRKSNLNPEIQIVLSARFRLTGDAQDRINNQMRANEEYRWRTQPLGWPSAGSTFTNP
ncbi:MAG: UDP-N-acetylmuramate dehydrogenase, partial [Candidatus Melainabacteria bacterium]|nr:UDP-N-acetylmuramate dehydrogenase [Candidatus Melainabacteria bacterium]